jgi:glycosyltransferase involved in cell wall biosynthesis
MKNVLIYFPDNVFPLNMGVRVKAVEKIKTLANKASVTFLSIVETQEQKEETVKLLSQYCQCEFIYRPRKKTLYGALLRIKWKIFDYFGLIPQDYMVANGMWLNMQMKRIARRYKSFDVVLCDYWYVVSTVNKYFKTASTQIIVDTHNVLSAQRSLELDKASWGVAPQRWLKKYRQLEQYNLSKADILIAVSKSDYEYYKENYPTIPVTVISTGINLDRINNISAKPVDNTILVYGNLGDSQNIIAFERLWQKIFPGIKEKVPDLKLLVVGSNPSKDMLKLNDLDYVNVTGFVQDPFDFIRQSKVHIVPMETGTGFRGRIPEVMGVGVPTIGTHNALDCVGLEGELQTFITDNDNEIADMAIKLLTDNDYWCRISKLSKDFIYENYSSQKTYKKLENYL